MNECFYPTCKQRALWSIYSEGYPNLCAMSCIEHIGHAIAEDQVSTTAFMSYIVMKNN